jgi:hypothetical protein
VIILDTNVVSELMKPAPQTNVVKWLEEQPVLSLFTTFITEAEIFYGLALLPEGARKNALHQAIAGMFEEDFAGRVLPFDGPCAQVYARIAAGRRQLGRPISQFDALIAAIAQSRGAAVATRNSNDFEDCGIQVINPWNHQR